MEILWTCLHEKIVSESYLQIRKVTTQHLSMHTYHTWMPASRRIFHDNLLFACGTESVKAASQLTHTLGPKRSSWHDWWVWWGCWWLVRMKNKRHRIHQKWSSDFTWTMKLKEQAPIRHHLVQRSCGGDGCCALVDTGLDTWKATCIGNLTENDSGHSTHYPWFLVFRPVLSHVRRTDLSHVFPAICKQASPWDLWHPGSGLWGSWWLVLSFQCWHPLAIPALTIWAYCAPSV